MKTTLRVGEKEYNLNGEEKKLGFDGLARQVPIFIYMIQEVDKKFISLRFPTERQEELMAISDQIDLGFVPFETDEELQKFYEEYDEVVGSGVYNSEIEELGGLGLRIEGDKYVLEYEFNGTCPTEKIFTKDGVLLSEISEDRVYIQGVNDKVICDKMLNVVDEEFFNKNYNPLIEMIMENLNEQTLTSVGVLVNEFENNKDLKEAFKKIYSKAYVEKRNALKDIICNVLNEDGSVRFLIDVTEDIIDEGLKLYPDKTFVFSVE